MTVADFDAMRHQDASGEAGAPIGIFVNGRLVELADEATDPHGVETARRVAERLGQRAEPLLVCHRHRDTAAVDCLICVPED